jgi:hypothetical protein
MLLSELFKPEPTHKTLHGYKIMSLSQFVHAKLYEAILPVEDNQIDDVSTDTEEISNDIIIKNEFDEEYGYAILKHLLKVRPKQLLKHNSKVSKTIGATLFDVGLPAMAGLIVNEKTDELVIVNTCASTGKCRTYCYVKNDGHIQFPEVFIPLSNKINFMVNDPHGFEHKIVKELHDKLNIANKQGTKVAIRWHDVGDYFSESYMDMAARIAKKFPTIDFYAYTKLGNISNNKGVPSNFHSKLSTTAPHKVDKPDINPIDFAKLLQTDSNEEMPEKSK